MKNNNWYVTVGFIFLLILIRVAFCNVNSILIIVYAINGVGLLYVMTQIMVSVYDKLNRNIKKGSDNIVIVRRNKKVKKNYMLEVFLIVIFLIAIAVILSQIKENEIAFSVLNDVIALITLGISIECNTLQEFLYNKATNM